MTEKGTIVYDYAAGLYINMTNKCPCRCSFCIRREADALGSADSLWLKEEPSWEEVIEELLKWDLNNYEEVVFCGYGEPTERLDDMIRICKWVHENTNLRTRLNTNGLADLVNGRRTAGVISENLDAVSISLNAPDRESYDALCSPRFGTGSYDAILTFAEELSGMIDDLTMSVVSVISHEDIEKCRKIAESLNCKFKIR